MERIGLTTRWFAAAALVVFVLAVASPGLASAQTVTGTVFGKVVDSSGAALPGASVTISSPQLIGGAQTRPTNQNGEYRFPALPPGTYTVAIDLASFQSQTRNNVVVAAGAQVAVDGELSVASVSETLTVQGGAPVLDVKSAALRDTATREFIENVPTGRAFTDVFNLMPGVVTGNYNVATTGTNSVHGGSVRNNVFSLDGVNVNDPLVAYPGTDVNLETIEEVQVTTAGMSAEFGSASGAVFNVITKSGSNTLSGQLNAYVRDKAMTSSNVTDALRAAGLRGASTQLTKSTDWGGSLGGPVIPNRLWYFGNYQRIDQTQTMINFPSLIGADQDTIFGKGTSQISPRNRIDGYYQYRLRYDEPFQPGVQEQDSRVWRRHRQNNHTTNLKWTSTFSDATFFELRGSIANQRRFTAFPNASDDDFGYIDSSTGRRSGGWYRELARPGYRNSRTVKGDLTHYATNLGPGSHELKGGLEFDWLINNEYREWLAGARVHILFDGRPDRIQLSNAPVDQKGRISQMAAYLQDQWSVSQRLTLSLGVRFEKLEGWYPEGANGGVNFPRQEFAELRDVIDFKNVAPRLGATYDLLGNRRTILKGTFGRFYNQVYTSEFDAAVPFAFGSKVYRWTDLNSDRIWQPGEESTLISDSTVPALGRVDPGVEQSYTDSGTIGVEHDLGNGIAVGATFIMKKESHLAETFNAALPFDTAYNAVTLPNVVTGEPITVYPLKLAFRGVPTVRLYTNPGAGTCSFCPDLERKYRAIELTFRRRMQHRWQLFGSYVYGRSEGNKGTGHTEAQGTVFASPNTLVNAYGRLALDRPHQLKLQGTVRLPYGVVLSGTYSGLSGTPWARQIRFLPAQSPVIVVESAIVVNAEPIGSQRFDFVHDVSMRAEIKFGLGQRRNLGLILDVFNLLNASTVTSVQQTRVDHVDFGKPGELVLARALRLGVRVGF